MTNKLNFLIGLLIISLSVLFDAVPRVQAQSVQDWSDPINISNSGSAYNPSLVIDDTGVFHLIWFDLFDGYKYTESADGLTWAESQSVSFPFSPKKTASESVFSIEEAPQPVFVLGSQNVVHVFWQDKKKALYYSRANSTILGKPTGWGGALKLSDSVMDFDAAVDSDGIVHLSYATSLDTATAPAGIYYRRFDGLQWLAPINLYASQYFRSIALEDAHVRIAVSNNLDVKSVYVVWDDRAQKRILISKSINSGLTWEESKEVVVPDERLGFSAPFNAEIATQGDNVLLTWQVGESGIRCAQYSRWSLDAGNQWENPVKMFDEISVCPQNNEFIFKDTGLSLLSFSSQGNLFLIAWNGKEWSRPQSQDGLLQFINPKTVNPILFHCQQSVVKQRSLFVVGCDDEYSKDIWFTSRLLDPLDSWFPSSSAWASPEMIKNSSQKISWLTSVADKNNRLHLVWAQAPYSKISGEGPGIYYSRWAAEQWSKPVLIIAELDRNPVQLSITVDTKDQILLTWLDENSGDLLFSWANSNRANNPSEWSQPVILPSFSTLNNFPDVLVDVSNNIVVAYSVDLNEERGIYFTQSSDFGKTWSEPVAIFNAVAASWDSVSRPKIGLTGDGRLHVLFTRISMKGLKEPDGLYYSQSSSGGITWSEPEIVSGNFIIWSDIISYDKSTIHRFWQEKNNSDFDAYHQVSHDSGLTWESPQRISNVNGESVESVSTIDSDGNLYFMQAVKADNLVIRGWKWEDGAWSTDEPKDFQIREGAVLSSFTSAITSQGVMFALPAIEIRNLNSEFENQLLEFRRSTLVSGRNNSSGLGLIPMPVVVATSTVVVGNQPSSTLTPVPSNLEDSTRLSLLKNLVGIILLIGVLFLILRILFAPSRIKNPPEKKQ